MSGCAVVSLVFLLALAITNVHCASLDRAIRTAEGQEVNEAASEIVFRKALVENLKEWRKFEEEEEKGMRQRRGTSPEGIRYWPGGVVPYEFGSGFNDGDKMIVEQAMLEWSVFTCVTFREAETSDTQKIRFESTGSVCRSDVGMILGKSQEIFLPSNCRSKGDVIRQLGHSLGLKAEQSRSDRDEYVEILQDNIKESEKKYYEVQANKYPSIKYDYSSIMHYSKDESSANGQLTIRTKDAKYQSTIGQKHGPSVWDIRLVNLMYDCHANCTENCAEDDFQTTECECLKKNEDWCKDSASDCADRLEECPESHEMLLNCTNACNYCEVFTILD